MTLTKEQRELLVLVCSRLGKDVDDALDALLTAFDAAQRCIELVQEDADEPCVYGDNCPRFVKSNHGQCRPCKARAAIAATNAQAGGEG